MRPNPLIPTRMVIAVILLCCACSGRAESLPETYPKSRLLEKRAGVTWTPQSVYASNVTDRSPCYGAVSQDSHTGFPEILTVCRSGACFTIDVSRETSTGRNSMARKPLLFDSHKRVTLSP